MWQHVGWQKDELKMLFSEGRMKMREKNVLSCADCGVSACMSDASETAQEPPFCLTKQLSEQVREKVRKKYKDPENMRFMAAAAQAELLGRMTRVEETIQIARSLGVRKLGIATCVGLLKETRIASKIFRAQGFTVYAVSCKCGRIRKTEIGLPQETEQGLITICNPILQAELLNEQQTELNVAIGLCVGHDCLFNKYSHAPVTTMITKDKALCHNPVSMLYTANVFYRHLLTPVGENTDTF